MKEEIVNSFYHQGVTHLIPFLLAYVSENPWATLGYVGFAIVVAVVGSKIGKKKEAT
jgi:hypothetical protein